MANGAQVLPDWTPAAAKWAIAAVVAIWASIPLAVQTLLVLMVIDYTTGVMKALGTKTLSSEVGLRGLRKKLASLILIATVHFLTAPWKLPMDFAATLASAFVINEVISIVENAADMGVPIPPSLLELLLRAKKVTGKQASAEEVKKELADAADSKAS